MVAHRGYVYIIGGTSGVNPTSMVYVASVNGGVLGSFGLTTPMPAARAGAAAVALNGFVFVFGGHDASNAPTASVFVAPINADGTLGPWSSAPDFPTPRWGHGVALNKNQVFLVGGENSTAPLAEIDTAYISFDGTVGPWSRAQDLQVPLSGASVLAYRDELAAVDYLSRVFGFVENREARMEFDGKYLCWLRVGTGVVMVSHANVDIHYIHSPLDAGLTTAIFHVYVHDIDTQYARAVEAGANITMPLDDAFYGERRYEATDPEGHRWHFGERFADIQARSGRPPAPPE